MVYMDLVQYVKSRTRCSTGMAKRAILAGCLTIDGKIIGIDYDRGGQAYLSPLIPSDLRDRIVIQEPTTVHLEKEASNG